MSVTPEVDKEPTIEVRLTALDQLFVHLLAVHPSSSSRYLTFLFFSSVLRSPQSNFPACTRMAPSP